MLLLVFLLVLNFAVSWWNSHAAGKIWIESKALGGWVRLLAWAGAVQAVCGFTIVFAVLLGGVLTGIHVLPVVAFNAIVNLTYLFIIVPILGSGLIITIESWVRAYRERDLASMGVAAWNTFATGWNTFDALDGGISDAFSNVGDFFDGDDDIKTIGVKIAVVIVFALSVGGAILLAYTIAKRAMGTLPLPQREVAAYR